MSINRLWHHIVLIAVSLGYVGVSGADDSRYQLCYRFQSGQFLHYEVDDKAEITTQLAENQSKSVQRTQILKSFRVVTVNDDGGAVLEPVIEKARMSSQAGEKAGASYDSTTDTVPPKEFEMLASTIGHPLARFQVASNGKLLKVSLLVKDVPKKFSEAAEKTDPTINFLIVFPEQPVKIGDKWNEKYETSVNVSKGLNQPVKLIKAFELASVTNDIATIRFRTSLLAPVEDPDILRQIATQTPSGTIEFDLKQGRIISRSLQIDEKVIGAFGAQSLLQARGESIERLVR